MGFAPFLAGGGLTALLKPKVQGWDVRPISVGEVLRVIVLLQNIRQLITLHLSSLGWLAQAAQKKIIHHLT